MAEKRSVKTILSSLKPQVEQICRDNAEVPPLRTEGVIAKHTLFDAYRGSAIGGVMRHIKRLPLLGSVLLLIKRKLLKWDA